MKPESILTYTIALPLKGLAKALDLRSNKPLTSSVPLTLDVVPDDFVLVYVEGAD